MTERQQNILFALRAMQKRNNKKAGREWLSISILENYDARSWRGLFDSGELRHLDCSRFKVVNA